jgi:hypothetical protein
MAILTPSQLQASNDSTYTTNGVGSITGAAARGFNTDFISSSITVSQTSSLSVASASVATSASYAATASVVTGTVVSASFAQTASYVNPLDQNVDITGRLYVSSSDTFDVVVNGQIFVSSSGTSSTTAPRITVTGSLGKATIYTDEISISTGQDSGFVTKDAIYNASSSVDRFGFTTNPAKLGISNWTSGPAIWNTDNFVNNVASIGFQSRINYGDGRVTILRPLVVSGSLNLSGSVNVTDQVNATSFSGSGALIVGVVSSSFALTASYALNAGTSIDTGSFINTSSFNTYTASINGFTGSIQTQVDNLQSATASYITSAQTSSMTVLSSSYAATASVLLGTVVSASNALTASYVNPLSQEVIITGSAILRPQFDGANYPFILNQASDITSTFGNFISTRNNDPLQSGSLTMSGSTNLILLNAGGGSEPVYDGYSFGFRANNSIIQGVPYISGSNGSGDSRPLPLFNNSNVRGINIFDDRPSTTLTPITIQGSQLTSTLTFNTSIAPAFVNSCNIVGGSILTITGSSSAQKSVVAVSSQGSNNTMLINSTTANSSFNSMILAGSNNTVLVSGSNTIMNSANIVGYQLRATGSANATTNFGSLFAGRWNASDNTSLTKETAFLVGTGTTNTARRTSLHVSASGLTTISNGLNVSSSLQLTGSLSIQSGSGDLFVYGNKQFNGAEYLSTQTQSGSSAVSQSITFNTTGVLRRIISR